MKSAAENLARHMPVSSLLEVILQHCNGGSSVLSCRWADALALLCLDRSTFLTVSLYPLDTLEILLVDRKPSCYGIHGYGLSLGLRIKDTRYHCLACETLCKPANIILSKKQTQRKISQGVAAFPLTDLFFTITMVITTGITIAMATVSQWWQVSQENRPSGVSRDLRPKH